MNIKHLFSFLSASLLISSNLWAISETNYVANYNSKIWPSFMSGKYGTFKGIDNLNINYKTFISNESKSKCLLILPGRQEPIEKYAEVIYDIQNSSVGKNLSIFIMDHRGQGSSDRMTENSQIGYVDHFSDYVDDVETFIDQVIKPQQCSKTYLLAHSLGGAIGLGVIAKNPNFFTATTFSAPMWQINTHPYPEPIAYSIVALTTKLGKGKEYAIGRGDYDLNIPFQNNEFTHSEQRYIMTMNTYRNFPLTLVGGPANRWVAESLKFTKMLRKHVKGLRIPMILLQAGQDKIVRNSGMDKVCDHNQFCLKTVFKNSDHEILMEQDLIRSSAINKVVQMMEVF